MSETKEWILCQREARRRFPPEGVAASVEFDFGPGRLRQPLVNLTDGGLAFEVGDEPLGVEPNGRLEHAVVRIGDVEFRGELTVVHVSRVAAKKFICGVRFHPATENDRGELARALELVAGG